MNRAPGAEKLKALLLRKQGRVNARTSTAQIVVAGALRSGEVFKTLVSFSLPSPCQSAPPPGA